MSELRIIGAGGHGRVAADCAEAAGTWSPIAFLDDAYPEGGTVGGWPVLGTTESGLRDAGPEIEFVVAIGDNGLRQSVTRNLVESGRRLATVIHPSAVISKRSTIGAGTVVFANVVVNAGAEIGPGSILNTACVVEHDCRVGAYCHLSPGALLAGEVSIGERSWIGVGASLRNGITVGADAIVGAGAAVVRDVPGGATVVGVPARALNSH